MRSESLRLLRRRMLLKEGASWSRVISTMRSRCWGTGGGEGDWVTEEKAPVSAPTEHPSFLRSNNYNRTPPHLSAPTTHTCTKRGTSPSLTRLSSKGCSMSMIHRSRPL